MPEGLSPLTVWCFGRQAGAPIRTASEMEFAYAAELVAGMDAVPRTSCPWSLTTTGGLIERLDHTVVSEAFWPMVGRQLSVDVVDSSARRVVGNNDAHGKNFSLRYLPESRQAVLAPAYDVLSTFAYRKTHNLTRKMAMSMAGDTAPSTGAVPSCPVAHRGTARHNGLVSDHYTIRLASGTRERLARRARRAGLPERALAQRYLEEGLRHDAHPLIQFLDGPTGRRASMIGSGLDVWEVIATVRDNDGSVEDAAAYLEISVGLVQGAAAYYGEYQDEIDAEIEFNEAEYQRGLDAAAAGERALRG